MITPSRKTENKAKELAAGYFKTMYGFEVPEEQEITPMQEKGSLEFLNLGLAWAKDFGDTAKEEHYYRAMRSLMQGENPQEENHAEECTVVRACVDAMQVFHAAHEIARIYRAACGITEADEAKEAASADELAYRAMLGGFCDGNATSCLAPMMYVDYLDLMGYTERILSNEKSYENSHQIIMARKARLMQVLLDKREELDTREGEKIYSGILQIYDAYKIKLLLEEK
jgi:ribonucleotide reductase alpha subunit